MSTIRTGKWMETSRKAQTLHSDEEAPFALSSIWAMAWLKGFHISKGMQSLDFLMCIFPAGMSNTCFATQPNPFASPFLGVAALPSKAAATF